MARLLFGNPSDELGQNMAWHGFYDTDSISGDKYPFPQRGVSRSAPAEPPFVDYDPKKGWHQGQPGVDRMPAGWKSTMHWARPIDGKRRGFIGRLMDGLTNEGSDVYVVINGDRRTRSRDNPHRETWSRWAGPYDKNLGRRGRDDDYTQSEGRTGHAAWANRSGLRYNFSTRKYEDGQKLMTNFLKGKMFSDAYWPENAERYDPLPLSWRTFPGVWGTRVRPDAGIFPGGRPMPKK